ncbi:MAG: DUF2520 domain-containing protein [Bacteroidales bacterium]|nr:DUF2520 domain-containing protein [Bacteroidales bacterium]
MIRSVNIIGAGNVGLHIGRKVSEKDQVSLRIYTRREDFSYFPEDMRSFLTNDTSLFSAKNDLTIIAVNDDNISLVAEKIKDHGQIVVHTSGSTPMAVLDRFQYYGVLYPLQTFSMHRHVKWSEVPLFLEYSEPSIKEKLINIAVMLSPNYRFISSDERLKVHVSAVFASNFVNHMFVQVKDLADQQNIDFADFLPLIRETIDKIFELTPLQAQTGPALRNDKTTLQKHLKALEYDKAKQKLYEILSKSIYNRGKDEEL